ncbi:MAG: glycoside hydrolase family 3 protein, partial [Promethearchaeota archaeon]
MSFKVQWEKYQDLDENEIETVARNILSKMSLKQKAFQMAGDKTILTGGISMLIRYNSKPIPAGADKKLGIPGIMFTDGPRGIVMNSATCFPVSMGRGASWDLILEEKIGNAMGIEARTLGANFYGGVCINILRHPSWGRAQETFGEDPFHVGMMGAALTRGIQKHVMACAKHFTCNSIENSRFKVNVKIDERTLREVYLSQFKRCVGAGIASIMNAYNKVNGYYCGHNKHLLREILKDEWKFKGFVITDFLYGIRDGKKAVNAGVDIEMPFNLHMKVKKLINLIKKKQISKEMIDDAVLRILRQKLRFNKKLDPNLYTKDKVACKDHIALALESAVKSIVLLKNRNDLLPLDAEKIKTIAVIGKLANAVNIGDRGSSRVYPPYVVTPLEGIKNIAPENVDILYYKGKNRVKTIKLAKNVDAVVLVVGYTYKDEGEYVVTHGGDRNRLELKPADERLILDVAEVNQNVIVIIEAGSAIISENWREKVPAILMAWYPGMEGGNAIGRILFGKDAPSAKLPCVFPKSNKQLPFFNNKVDDIEYEYYYGYKFMDKKGFQPAFPFGFGLSYTTFEYQELEVNSKQIKKDDVLSAYVKIQNAGD